MRARALTMNPLRVSAWRRAPRRLDAGLTGPGAAMLWVAIFGRAEPRLKLPLSRVAVRLREIALALLLGALGLALVLAARLALAMHGAVSLHDGLHDWFARLV
ncbi:MAG TPA: hypothetical protein VMB81_31305 [Candidatus Sulfotelmatobacter sp.]|nr:hypothetical protein [Candidatus Sulfotelmatobacter sp.]